MGFLKKFLVEEIPEEPMYCEDDTYETETDITADVNTENVSQENMINDIYNQNELSNSSKSIFKVEELINSLPKEMPNETKKTTVLSMLSIFGLTVKEVSDDGKNRVAVIDLAREEILNENHDAIVNNNAVIEKKKLEIQELEKDNVIRETVIKNTDDTIETEIKRISKLINFIGGVI